MYIVKTVVCINQAFKFKYLNQYCKAKCLANFKCHYREMYMYVKPNGLNFKKVAIKLIL